jgi:hypothetical protein
VLPESSLHSSSWAPRGVSLPEVTVHSRPAPRCADAEGRGDGDPCGHCSWLPAALGCRGTSVKDHAADASVCRVGQEPAWRERVRAGREAMEVTLPWGGDATRSPHLLLMQVCNHRAGRGPRGPPCVLPPHCLSSPGPHGCFLGATEPQAREDLWGTREPSGRP